MAGRLRDGPLGSLELNDARAPEEPDGGCGKVLTTFRTFPVRLLYWANDAFPVAKSLIPKSLHRFVLLQIVGVNKTYEKMRQVNPERLFLEREALPWVRDHYRRVLFVGTASYTYHYETLFGDDPDRYTTI